MNLEKVFDEEGILTKKGLEWIRSLDRYQMTYFLDAVFTEGWNQDTKQLIDNAILKGV